MSSLLDEVIAKAAKLYDVPADLLHGIALHESGGAVPNNYVNTKGYGGTFGTSGCVPTGPFGANGSAPARCPTLQEQADESASVLATQLRLQGGDIAAALSKYSGGGYTSVPGQTTFGHFTPGMTAAGPPAFASASAVFGAGTAAGSGDSAAMSAECRALDVKLLGELLNGKSVADAQQEWAASGCPGVFNPKADTFGGLPGDVASIASGVAAPFVGFVHDLEGLLGKLPRLGLIVGGGLLLLLGLGMMGAGALKGSV